MLLVGTVQTFFAPLGHWMTVGFVRFSRKTVFFLQISSAVCISMCLYIFAFGVSVRA